METVKNILRNHKNRANSIQSPHNYTSVNSTLLTQQENDKEQDYYKIDKYNMLCTDYFDINSDVRAFAQNFEQILRIRRNTIEQAAFTKQQVKSKFYANKQQRVKVKSDENPFMFKTNIVTFPSLRKRQSEENETKESFEMLKIRRKKSEKRQINSFRDKASRFLKLMKVKCL